MLQNYTKTESGYTGWDSDGNYITKVGTRRTTFAPGEAGYRAQSQAVKARHGGTSFNDLESQLADLRAKAEDTDARLHKKANGQPRASQVAGGSDLEYQTSLKAKQQYQQSREVEENERVSDFAFLANGGKVSDLMASKGTYAELHILNKTGEAQRLRKLAKQEALSPEDEAWIQSMFALAGQREG
ncbi:hypothetical protein PITCH_A1150048 [uncultured Desulfobacterium sp.]|uniref:Uncharacterized protein n=1 Tax=uncultured Desulfobacterium sp. TaxID=201089 RepID=A0A445MRE0_9BACT|nr:hypothetical protein PITCH_A1150048 [uncultured Desulfobacterium sp.]